MTPLRLALIGANIGRSRFAAGQALLAEAHELTVEYTAIDTADEPDFDFVSTVDLLRADGFWATSVTHPWKPAAASYAGAAMDPETAPLGAANILVFRPALRGHNTDYLGTLGAWRHVMSATGPGRVAMAGAGGVARAIAPALMRLGAADIAIWDTDAARAETLAAEIGGVARAVPAETAEETARNADGLVNATPLGMAGYGGTAFPDGWIAGQSWAFDAVYTPTWTAFLVAADTRGLTCITGFDLFRFMALHWFETATGHAPDPDTALPALATLQPKEEA